MYPAFDWSDHRDCSIELGSHGVLLIVGAPCQLRLLVGPEHGRTIPLADLDGTKIPQCSRSSASPRRAMLRVGSAGDIRQWNRASSSCYSVARARGRSKGTKLDAKDNVARWQGGAARRHRAMLFARAKARGDLHSERTGGKSGRDKAATCQPLGVADGQADAGRRSLHLQRAQDARLRGLDVLRWPHTCSIDAVAEIVLTMVP
jgi:hypothetical protein